MRIHSRMVSDLEAFSHYPADGIEISGVSCTELNYHCGKAIGTAQLLCLTAVTPAHVPYCVQETDFQKSLWSRRFMGFRELVLHVP